MKKILSSGYLVLLLVMLYAPIVIIAIFSFTESKVLGNWTGFSTELYSSLFSGGVNNSLIDAIKKIEIDIEGFRGINEAIVTAGGISVKEIDPSTMQSKLISGLYFAGEIIDVDAYTGGFNLQIAFSTGSLAGSSI